jgi:uncharacterized protein (TIGR02391 family)
VAGLVHVREEEQPHEVEEVARRAVALGTIVEAVHGLDHVDLRPAHVVDCHHQQHGRGRHQAIVKLKRRLEEARALDPARIKHDDPQAKSAAQNFSDTVLEVYGPDSPEYRRFRYFRIWQGPLMVNMRESEIQRSFAEGVPDLIGALENLIRRLEERKADFGADTTSRVRSAFEGLDLHPRIASVCADLYRGGHYRNAVLDASVALVNYVKEKSRKHDLDGSGLMTTVFSKNNPILAFNDRKDKTDEDEQEGMMHLFVGAVLGLRNPRAHALLDDSPEMALEYIALISLLAKRLDQAKRTTP